MHIKSGSQRSEKCRWYQLVDEFMFNRANVVSHAHASAINPDGPKYTATSNTNTTEQGSVESTSKSPDSKRKDDMFMKCCIRKIRESGRALMKSLKASDKIKMALLMSMQQTMKKLVEKIQVHVVSIGVLRERLCNANLCLCHPKTFCNSIYPRTWLIVCLVVSVHCNLKLLCGLLLHVFQRFSAIVVNSRQAVQRVIGDGQSFMYRCACNLDEISHCHTTIVPSSFDTVSKAVNKVS